MKRCHVDVKKPNKREARKRHAARRATSNWGWQDGVVNVEGEHIELRYGDGETTAYEQWLPITLIGKPTNHVFPVRWIMSRDSRSRQRMIDAAREELDFYLVEHPKGFPGTGHPWGYAIYHCNTAANMYSSVHWSYFPNGNREQRHSSMIVTLRDGTKGVFKPSAGAKSP
jgi:hypothetical protein